MLSRTAGWTVDHVYRSTDTTFFRELYELYRLTYFVYLAGDELRGIAQDHPLLRYLREFGGYDGTDPPLSIVCLALTRYHDALNQAIQG